ncbi:restriction endonuclease subunit S [Alteromonas sp. 14N.309.X.WAT.G.H12]|uniref:restriction endonuclease subunit S n=1 Tax=Alteromonas sp. 14N.309.X.WAT.G.H12 TaxID=3120824 RepID=UPI002FD3D367
MASEWPRVRISEVCELIVDCVNKTAPKSEFPTEFKMLRTPNVKNGRVDTSNCFYVTEDTYLKWTRRATVNRNDVLLTREAPLGEVGIVKSEEKLFLGQRLMQYRADQTKLDPDFLVYSFLSPDLQHQLRMHEGSGSVVSHIRVGDCSKFEINLPPLTTQKSIAKILGELDQRIELNRKTNQTLEQMAQALFKSWFIDFDPVVDNALAAGNPIPEELAHRVEVRKKAHVLTEFQPLPQHIRSLFPSEFEQTGEQTAGIDGWMPKGWTCKPVSQALIVNPKVKLSKGEAARFADMKAIPTNGFHVEDVIEKEFNGGAKFQQNDVLLARITPCLENGKTALVDFLKDGEVGFGSTEFIVIRGSGALNYPYVACLSRLDSFRKHCIQNMVGSSGRQRVQNSCFDSFFLSLPKDERLLPIFDRVCKPMFEKMTVSGSEIKSLAKMRDTLLPRLISGELKLNKDVA